MAIQSLWASCNYHLRKKTDQEVSLQSGSLLSAAERILLETSQENICWKHWVFIFSCLTWMAALYLQNKKESAASACTDDEEQAFLL